MKQPVEFGDYYLFERIAVGGMAEVFRAASYGVEGFERVVALKRVLPQISEDQAFIDMFVDEAKIAVQLDHPNISRIYDLGNADDSYYIAMEYVSGHDARAVFDRLNRRDESLSIEMCCHLVKEVCEALEYAHTKSNSDGEPLSLIHRDVSPQNILVGYDGQVKLIDFGIAKAAGKATKTRSGILKGKFGYMSPEHVRGRPIDRRSDIFALAVVLYELLTLERCFRGKDDFSTLEKVRRVDFRAVRELNRAVPPELEKIVMKGLAKSPKSRFQSAAEFQEALQTFLYQVGSFVSRKHVSKFMTSLFEEEKEQERVILNKFRQYARLHIPAARRASSLDDLIAGSAVKLAPTTKLLPDEENKIAPSSALLDSPSPSSIEDRSTENMPDPPPSLHLHDRPTVKSNTNTKTNAAIAPQIVKRPNTDRLRLLLIGLAALVLTGSAFLYLKAQQMEPGSIQITTEPSEVTIYVDSVKTYAGPTPITLNNIAPKQRYAINLTADEYDPQERRISLEPGETRQLRIALTPTSGRTKLTLRTIPPGAEVVIDGKRIGKTPLDQVSVKSGKRVINFIRDGVTVKSETVLISLGETKTHEVSLPPSNIDVDVSVSPRSGSTINIRDSKGQETKHGSSPLRVRVPNDGSHELIVRAPGYETDIRRLKSKKSTLGLSVVLTPTQATLKKRKRARSSPSMTKLGAPLNRAKSKRIENELTQKTDDQPRGIGYLSIHSFPSAECFIDGTPIGTTPVYRSEVSAGAHAIMLKRSRAPSFQHIVTVQVEAKKEEKVVYRHPKP